MEAASVAIAAVALYAAAHSTTQSVGRRAAAPVEEDSLIKPLVKVS